MTLATLAHPEQLSEFDLLIGGERVPALEGGTLPSTDPTTGREWAVLASATAADVDAAVRAAADAFASDRWRGLSATRRGRLLTKLAELVAEAAEEIARLESVDNGKLYRESLGQIGSVPDWLYYYGGLADKIEGSVIPLDR